MRRQRPWFAGTNNDNDDDDDDDNGALACARKLTVKATSSTTRPAKKQG